MHHVFGIIFFTSPVALPPSWLFYCVCFHFAPLLYPLVFRSFFIPLCLERWTTLLNLTYCQDSLLSSLKPSGQDQRLLQLVFQLTFADGAALGQTGHHEGHGHHQHQSQLHISSVGIKGGGVKTVLCISVVGSLHGSQPMQPFLLSDVVSIQISGLSGFSSQ